MWTALRFSILTLVFSGIVYPLFMTLLGQCFFPYQSNGSLIANNKGQIIGSELIGQTFSKPGYFQGRPSVNQYDGANSGGSNYSSTNKKLVQRVKEDTFKYSIVNHTALVPVDAVTASASGLDPDISLINAQQQAARIATVRHTQRDNILKIIEKHTIQSILSDNPSVRVLTLNIDLDQHYPLKES
jgi:K+-transporting ATPase ATPase C chain